MAVLHLGALPFHVLPKARGRRALRDVLRRDHLGRRGGADVLEESHGRAWAALRPRAALSHCSASL